MLQHFHCGSGVWKMCSAEKPLNTTHWIHKWDRIEKHRHKNKHKRHDNLDDEDADAAVPMRYTHTHTNTQKIVDSSRLELDRKRRNVECARKRKQLCYSFPKKRCRRRCWWWKISLVRSGSHQIYVSSISQQQQRHSVDVCKSENCVQTLSNNNNNATTTAANSSSSSFHLSIEPVSQPTNQPALE